MVPLDSQHETDLEKYCACLSVRETCFRRPRRVANRKGEGRCEIGGGCVPLSELEGSDLRKRWMENHIHIRETI